MLPQSSSYTITFPPRRQHHHYCRRNRRRRTVDIAVSCENSSTIKARRQLYPTRYPRRMELSTEYSMTLGMPRNAVTLTLYVSVRLPLAGHPCFECVFQKRAKALIFAHFLAVHCGNSSGPRLRKGRVRSSDPPCRVLLRTDELKRRLVRRSMIRITLVVSFSNILVRFVNERFNGRVVSSRVSFGIVN